MFGKVGFYDTEPVEQTRARNLVITFACDKKTPYRIASEIRTGAWKKTFVCFTDDERILVDEAAEIERRTVSSFIANAALSAAEATIKKITSKSSAAFS